MDYQNITIAIWLVSLILPFYSYFIFPVILFVLSRIRKIEFKVDRDYKPKVSLLVSAYNEEAVIKGKIENCLALDYPEDKLQIIIINDGSSDGTDKIVKQYKEKGVIHNRVDGRGGKNIAINESWSIVEGEIVVFSDANSLYEPDAVSLLVAHLKDERVGAVCGELRYIDTESGSAKGEGLYWKYEQVLKKHQSRMGQVLVLNGSIFAIKKELFESLNARIANDFQIAVDVSSKGFAIVYEPEAVAKEKAASLAKDEFKRKARIIARGFQGFVCYLPKFKGIRLFFILSHKFLRWFVWLFMILALVSNILLLDYTFFRWFLVIQLLFYAFALFGPILQKLNISILTVPHYFCMINLAAFLGFIRFITGKQKGSWEPPKSAR